MEDLILEFVRIFNISERESNAHARHLDIEECDQKFDRLNKTIVPSLSFFTYKQILYEWKDFIKFVSSSLDQPNISAYILKLFLLLTFEIFEQRGIKDYTNFWKFVLSTEFIKLPLRQDLMNLFSSCNDYSALAEAKIYASLLKIDKNVITIHLNDYYQFLSFFKTSVGVIEYISIKFIKFEIVEKFSEMDDQNNNLLTKCISDELSPQAANVENEILSLENSSISLNRPLNFRVCNIRGFSKPPSCVCKLSPFSLGWATSDGYLGCTAMVITNNPANGRCINGLGSRVFKIEPIPNTMKCYTCSEDSYVRLWTFKEDLKPSIKLIAEYLGHNFPVTDVLYNPRSDNQFASSSFDTTVRLWDVSYQSPLRIMAGHFDAINSISFSNQGRLIASASTDKTSRIFDIRTGEFVRLFVGHNEPVISVCFYPDDNFLVTSGFDNKIIKWDTRNGKMVNSYIASSPGYNLSVSPIADCIILINLNGHVVILDKSLEQVLFTSSDTEYNHIHYNWANLISKNFAELVGYELSS